MKPIHPKKIYAKITIPKDAKFIPWDKFFTKVLDNFYKDVRRDLEARVKELMTK